MEIWGTPSPRWTVQATTRPAGGAAAAPTRLSAGSWAPTVSGAAASAEPAHPVCGSMPLLLPGLTPCPHRPPLLSPPCVCPASVFCRRPGRLGGGEGARRQQAAAKGEEGEEGEEAQEQEQVRAGEANASWRRWLACARHACWPGCTEAWCLSPACCSKHDKGRGHSRERGSRSQSREREIAEQHARVEQLRRGTASAERRRHDDERRHRLQEEEERERRWRQREEDERQRRYQEQQRGLEAKSRRSQQEEEARRAQLDAARRREREQQRKGEEEEAQRRKRRRSPASAAPAAEQRRGEAHRDGRQPASPQQQRQVQQRQAAVTARPVLPGEAGKWQMHEEACADRARSFWQRESPSCWQLGSPACRAALPLMPRRWLAVPSPRSPRSLYLPLIHPGLPRLPLPPACLQSNSGRTRV